MLYLAQCSTCTVMIGPFVDDTDGATVETGLTIVQADVRLSKNGGNMAQKAEGTNATHDEVGVYACPLGSADTSDLGRLNLYVHQTGSLSVFHEYMVIPKQVHDSLVLGSDSLDVETKSFLAALDLTTNMKAAVAAECGDALTTYDPPTKGELDTAESNITTQVNANETKIDTMQGNVTDILSDTGEIQGKLPTNEIMGSSDKTDKDDEIDAIKTKTDKLTFNAADMVQSDVREVNDGAVSGVNDFKADVSNLDTTVSSRAPANEYDSELTAIQADLDNPNQYKADVSGVSTFDPTSDEVDVGKVKGGAVSGVNDFKSDVSNLDTTVSSRSSHTANNVRDAILSDSTPFDGAKIDATVSSRSSLTTFNTLIADIWAYATRTITGTVNLSSTTETQIDSIETLVTYIKKLGNNKCVVDHENNQMIIYDDDKVTPLITFDLKDYNGNATHENVYERDPV